MASLHLSMNVIVFLPSGPKPTLFASPTGVLKPDSSVNLTCEATLTCEIDVDSLQITWDGPRIVSSSNCAYRIMKTHSGLKYSSLLNIQYLEETDEGEYVCTFRDFNIGPFLNGSIFVEVQGEEV